MGNRHLPVIIEQGLGTLRISRTRATTALVHRVGLDVTCRKGCDHCCHYPVRVSILEGILLYRELQRLQLWNGKLRQALERHSKQTYELAPEVWLLANIACPLLSDHQCGAHGARPFVCRMTVSVGDPDLCKPAHFGRGSFVAHPSESAAYNHEVQGAAKNAQSRLLHHPVPISTAVLVGHHLVEHDWDPEDIDRGIMSRLEAIIP